MQGSLIKYNTLLNEQNLPNNKQQINKQMIAIAGNDPAPYNYMVSIIITIK